MEINFTNLIKFHQQKLQKISPKNALPLTNHCTESILPEFIMAIVEKFVEHFLFLSEATFIPCSKLLQLEKEQNASRPQEQRSHLTANRQHKFLNQLRQLFASITQLLTSSLTMNAAYTVQEIFLGLGPSHRRWKSAASMKLPSYPSLTSLESLLRQDGVDASLKVDQAKRLLIRQLMQYTNNNQGNHSLSAPAAPPRIAASDSIFLVVSLASCSSSASLSLPSSVYDHYYLAQDTAYTLPLPQPSSNSRQRQQHRRHIRIQPIVSSSSDNAPQTARRQRLVQLRADRQTSRHLTAAQQTTTTEQSMMVAEAMSSHQQQPAKEEKEEEEGQPPPDDRQQPPHRHHLQVRLSFVEEEEMEDEEQLPLHSDDDARKDDSYSRSCFFLLPHRGIKVLTGRG